jgi:hypothetical protein
MSAEVNHDKLRTAFIAGRIDAACERGEKIPDGVELLIRIVLGEADIKVLAQYSKVLFKETEKPPVSPIASFREERVEFPLNGQGVGGVPVTQSLLRTRKD